MMASAAISARRSFPPPHGRPCPGGPGQCRGGSSIAPMWGPGSRSKRFASVCCGSVRIDRARRAAPPAAIGPQGCNLTFSWTETGAGASSLTPSSTEADGCAAAAGAAARVLALGHRAGAAAHVGPHDLAAVRARRQRAAVVDAELAGDARVDAGDLLAGVEARQVEPPLGLLGALLGGEVRPSGASAGTASGSTGLATLRWQAGHPSSPFRAPGRRWRPSARRIVGPSQPTAPVPAH